jgi:cytochrome P450
MTFFLMLATHPEVQKRAQKEIDEVVGLERLPDFDDRPQLVYLEAVLREIFRWQQTLPLGKIKYFVDIYVLTNVHQSIGLPHATTEDDVYDGYFIPKGTVVIGHARYVSPTASFDKNQVESSDFLAIFSMTPSFILIH